MPNKLPIPDDLQHLIEKRDGVERRRASATDADGSSDSAQAPKTEETDERRQAIRRTEDLDTK